MLPPRPTANADHRHHSTPHRQLSYLKFAFEHVQFLQQSHGTLENDTSFRPIFEHCWTLCPQISSRASGLTLWTLSPDASYSTVLLLVLAFASNCALPLDRMCCCWPYLSTHHFRFRFAFFVCVCVTIRQFLSPWSPYLFPRLSLMHYSSLTFSFPLASGAKTYENLCYE